MEQVRTTVGRFKEFLENNRHVTTTRFAVTGERRGDTEEVDVDLLMYRDGTLVTTQFCPPSAVRDLKVEFV